MTTLRKLAQFTFDPGSPFVPPTYAVVCTGVPDPVQPPADPFKPGAGASFTGASGAFPVYDFIQGPNGQQQAIPRCISGRIDLVTGRCL